MRRADGRQAADRVLGEAARRPDLAVVGDAAGSVNPFNGEGISVAYETGRFAADAVDEALATGDGLALAALPRRGSTRTYGLYFKVARAFVKAIGNPAVMRELTRVGFRSRTLMEWVLRIMANLLRPDERRSGRGPTAPSVVKPLVAKRRRRCADRERSRRRASLTAASEVGGDVPR